jgi:hypothetical protein
MKVIENSTHWHFICPATGDVVSIPKNDRWTYNGDSDRPTFEPSINKIEGRPGQSHAEMYADPHGPASRNHFFVRDGQIQYLADCTHQLKSTTVQIEDFPANLADYYSRDWD